MGPTWLAVSFSNQTKTFLPFFLLQISAEVLPEMQPELPEECWKPPGHEALPSGRVHRDPHPAGSGTLLLRQHVRPQQQQTWQRGQVQERG